MVGLRRLIIYNYMYIFVLYIRHYNVGSFSSPDNTLPVASYPYRFYRGQSAGRKKMENNEQEPRWLGKPVSLPLPCADLIFSI